MPRCPACGRDIPENEPGPVRNHMIARRPQGDVGDLGSGLLGGRVGNGFLRPPQGPTDGSRAWAKVSLTTWAPPGRLPRPAHGVPRAGAPGPGAACNHF